MEERDEILIGRYLTNELSETERAEVDLRLKEDALFRQDVMNYEMAKEALLLQQRAELRDRFKMRDQRLDVEPGKTGNPYSFLLTILSVATILVLTVYLSKDDHFLSRAVSPASSDERDSIEKHQPLPIDSSGPVHKQETKPENQEKDKNQKQQHLEMADAKRKGAELFTEYFQPYKDVMMDPTTRGMKDLSVFEKYQIAYWEGDYHKAVALFSELPGNYQTNDNFRFFQANALLETGNIDTGIIILESIVKNKNATYWTESQYALALSYIQQGELNKANSILKIYIASEKAKYKEDAMELSNAIFQ